ncbi:MAG: EpsI family protein [Acidobacteriaceae bacterium]|nr:EpsI family protein [Acidobacteriaceae bacterium]
MDDFLKSKTARILTVVLLGQAAVFYGLSRAESIPTHRPLAQFSLEDSDWRMNEEMPLDKESLAVLKADDILSRLYVNQANGRIATLFVAYFETQRTGKTPHSPKNCLPGSGWVPAGSEIIAIPVPGEQEPVRVNRYIVSRGQNQSVVLYWYQNRNRVIASEYTAKIYTVADSIRYNRSDTALVRVVVGVNGGNTQAAIDTATDFVKAFFEPLKNYLPA